MASVRAAETNTAVRSVVARLVNGSGGPVAGIRLHVWRPGSTRQVAADMTDAAGYAVFLVEPGVYFVGGDVTALKDTGAYGDYLDEKEAVRMYYISPAVRLGAWGEQTVLKLVPGEYLDIVRFARRPVHRLSLVQRDSGLSVRTDSFQAETVRLFIPLRQNYEIGGYESPAFLPLRPVYASPGEQFVLDGV